MKVSALEIDLRQLLVRHHDARGTSLRIQHARDVEAGLGGRGSDQVDNHHMADERFAAPVLANEREQAMLDLVPLAGARRQIWRMSSSASLRTLLLVHRKGDSGSPRLTGSTHRSRSASKVGSLTTARLRPPPDRRMRWPQAGIRRRQLLQAPRNGLARNASGADDRRDATAPQALRFSRCRQPPLTFVQKRFHAHKTFLDRSCIRGHQRAIAALVDQIN
jgi:hypothetical protein